ncbi:Domain of unknown function DUF4496 [Cinara cedri]|uniref:CCDC81 HU domain-containing protein n=1 Tax=Cinara cedri TaxID=506608 RepID=A0A5E4NHM1_9HEMI|nr:Domain of unknown function DUF4496 [Cinara cedri]
MALRDSDVLRDGVVKKTMENFKTKIGKEYSAKDVIKTWDCISKWIENKLVQDKGVLIKGIGYFTLAQWEIGQGYANTIRKPVFVVDKKLVNDYNLSRNKAYNTGKIREYYLSLSSVAQDYKLNVNMVTDCFKEVVVAFRRLLFEERDCELPFSKIGKLQIKNKTATMKFYQEFLDKQNKNWKNRMEIEKKKHQSVNNYEPDWDTDQYEYQKRPCSAISAISRPASSLSQYRPGTGYAGVLPGLNSQMHRPCSRLCTEPGDQNRPSSRQSLCSYNQGRPTSRSSIQSRESKRPCSAMSAISRPTSSMSKCRPGTANADEFMNSNGQTSSRPGSRLCTESNDQPKSQPDQARPTSRESVHSDKFVRPVSRLSMVSSRPDSRLCAQQDEHKSLQSRLSLRSCDHKARPMSRTSVRSNDSISNLSCRPDSRQSLQSDKKPSPKSRSPAEQSCNQLRPTSSMSNRLTEQKMISSRLSNRSCTSLKHSEIQPLLCPNPCAEKSVANNNNSVPESPSPDVIIVQPNSEECNNTNKYHIKIEKPTLMNIYSKDDQLCYSCCIRKHRLSNIDIMNPDILSSANNENGFMRGDNPINGLNGESVLKKRKNQLKEISNYNYVTGNKLLDAIKKENNRIRKDKNYGNCIFNQRPESKSMCKEKKFNLKRSLLDQIEHNKIKKETNQCSSLKSENQIRDELIKSLHDERMRNIEAKNRSKENYLILLDKDIEDKHAYKEEMKKKYETTDTFKNILDTNNKIPANDKRELANYQLKQKMARSLLNCEQIKENIDFEKRLLNRIKREEETMQEKMLQKKLNLKKFMAEDLNNLQDMTGTGRDKNQVPSSYPMSFPLKKTGERCQLCKKNALGCPAEKISDQPR